MFVVPATGGAPKQITSGAYEYSGAFAWSSDGKSIYASSHRIPDAEYSLEGGEIYAYSVDDGSVKQLTGRKGPDTEPVPGPGGKKIAYIGHDWKFQSYTVNHLYLMNPDGSDPKCLTASLDRDVRAPHWSWDGKTIYFLVDDRGSTQLYSAYIASGEVKPATSGVQQLGLGGGFSMANNAMIATVRSTPTSPVTSPCFRLIAMPNPSG